MKIDARIDHTLHEKKIEDAMDRRLSERPLYVDKSLLDRHDFVRYLANMMYPRRGLRAG